MKNKFAVIILAAGKGKRMDGNISKVLYKIGGVPIISKTLQTLEKIKPNQIVVVVGYDRQSVKKIVGKNVSYAYDEKQIGTGNAAKVGLAEVQDGIDTVVVLNGDDSAFYKEQTLKDVIKTHQEQKSVLTFVTLIPRDPTGLGRVVRENGELVRVVEEKDASAKERKIKETNDGLYVFQRGWLERNISRIKKSKVTNEYYILDLIGHALSQKQKVTTFKLADPEEWHGINTPQDLESANQKAIKKVHIMGIAGAGAAAVAGIAKSYGFQVSGCDISPNSPYVEKLGINILVGHDKIHVGDIDMLVYSPAITKLDVDNPEILEAKKKGIPTITWQEFQGKFLQKGKFVIAVAGAYGKSTTTSMIAHILVSANQDPTAEIGAKVLNWDSNFKIGKSEYYVCESDEYNDNFLNYYPDIAVVLNLAWDHPDYFKNKEQLYLSYIKFIENIKAQGTLVTSDEVLSLVGPKIRRDIKVIKIKKFPKVMLSIIGDFRKQNADAALTVASILKMNTKEAAKSLLNFKGVARRLEYKGSVGSVKFYDDYAVQPYTILKTANALKDKFPNKKVLLVLEPHTFSRIETFFESFVKNLRKSKVDEIMVVDVFAAREKGNVKHLSQKLAERIGAKAKYSGSLEETAQHIAKNFKDFDVVFSMGAGNSYKLFDLVLKI